MSAEFDRAMKSKGRVIKSLPPSALQGSAIDKIPNILHCTLPPRPIYQTLLSDFSTPRIPFSSVVKAHMVSHVE